MIIELYQRKKNNNKQVEKGKETQGHKPPHDMLDLIKANIAGAFGIENIKSKMLKE